MIALGLASEARAVARLGGFSDRLHGRLRETVTRLGVALQAAAVANAAGGVLARRSGRLAQAIARRETEDAGIVSVAVGFDPARVPYGAIQEFGGTTRAHLIAAKRGRALAFSLGGQLVFARQVNHPGAHIPAHSFLRAALAALAPEARTAMSGAVAAAVRP